VVGMTSWQATRPDVRKLLVGLVGKPLTTLEGQPNRILEVDLHVTVTTERSAAGQRVPMLKELQQALDRLAQKGEVTVTAESVMLYSSSIGGGVPNGAQRRGWE